MFSEWVSVRGSQRREIIGREIEERRAISNSTPRDGTMPRENDDAETTVGSERGKRRANRGERERNSGDEKGRGGVQREGRVRGCSAHTAPLESVPDRKEKKSPGQFE